MVVFWGERLSQFGIGNRSKRAILGLGFLLGGVVGASFDVAALISSLVVNDVCFHVFIPKGLLSIRGCW